MYLHYRISAVSVDIAKLKTMNLLYNNRYRVCYVSSSVGVGMQVQEADSAARA